MAGADPSGRLSKHETPPACQGPLVKITPPDFSVPPGACDCHAHVIGDPALYPFVAGRSYTPPPATEAQYFRMLDTLGMDRGVLVQVSVHGTCNRLMVEVLRRHSNRLRGVAVVDATVPDHTLRDLHQAGVRGVRFNNLFGGGTPLEQLDTLSARIADLGWHIQLLLDGRTLEDLAPRLLRLPVDVVLDHLAHIPASSAVDGASVTALLRLLDARKVWVKLSGANRISVRGFPFDDTTPLAQILAARAPDRCLWGSDWPHVAVDGPMFDTGALLRLFAAWVPDETVRRRILVDNPARLYDFPATGI